MKLEQLKYIFRNIGRNKKQSFFTILCIVISSSIILGNISLNNGIQSSLKEGINQAISGQLTVYSTNDEKVNILESRLKEQNPFRWTDEETALLKSTTEDITVNRRIRFGSLISYNEETSYVNIHALEPAHIERMKKLIAIKEGTMPADGKEILISETMAGDLHCSIGDTLLLVADNIYEYMSDEVATVSGIFAEKGLTIFLNYMAFVPYRFGSEMVQVEEDECLELVINPTTNQDIPDETVKQIEKKLTTTNEAVSIASWDKTVPLFYSIANIWKGSGYLTQVLFIVFSLMILTNLASLIVYSRKKEFGTLLAIGFSWIRITGMVCLEYLLIAFFAVLTSGLLTVGQFALLPETGILIPSKDMQSALMTEFIRPFLTIADWGYVLLLFSLTMLLAVLISIMRIKKLSPVALINNY